MIKKFSETFPSVVSQSLVKNSPLMPRLLVDYSNFVKSEFKFERLKEEFQKFRLNNEENEGQVESSKDLYQSLEIETDEKLPVKKKKKRQIKNTRVTGTSTHGNIPVRLIYDETEDYLYKGQTHSETHQPNGFGVKVSSDGTSYSGFFSQGEFDIYGEYHCFTGAIYRGEYDKGVKNGRGTYIFSDGKKFEG